MKVEKPRGTRDFAPDEMWTRTLVERKMSCVIENYGYRKVSVPTFERSELFKLKSGEEIAKHMYVFEDKGGRELCLRPEATASVCRMFAEELRAYQKPVKVYYSGPMFRYEEPQKGRYREFWQIGVELIGPSGPESDAEVIEVAAGSLKSMGLRFELEVGHLGILRGLMQDLKVKEKVQDDVISAIDRGQKDRAEKLVKDKVFFELVELKGDKKIIKNAEKILKDYENASKALKEFKGILSYLDALEVDYSINLGIARGLEYYTGMVFEIRGDGLGAQNQICGGGRYDNLVELFSSLSVPAVGFAFGFDRVVEAVKEQGIEIPKKKIDLVVAPVSDEVREEAMKIASRFRGNCSVEVDLMNRKLGKILEYASRVNARYTIIVGPKELEKGLVVLRDMKSGTQKEIDLNEIERIF